MAKPFLVKPNSRNKGNLIMIKRLLRNLVNKPSSFLRGRSMGIPCYDPFQDRGCY